MCRIKITVLFIPHDKGFNINSLKTVRVLSENKQTVDNDRYI